MLPGGLIDSREKCNNGIITAPLVSKMQECPKNRDKQKTEQMISCQHKIPLSKTDYKGSVCGMAKIMRK